MNFKTAISVSSLAIFAAASTLVVGPAAQARSLTLPCLPSNSARCMAYEVRNPRFLCPRGYRAVKARYSLTREITCIKNGFVPIPNHTSAYNVTSVNYGTGVFKQALGKQWIEKNNLGTFTLQEIRRDASTIYLKIPNRNIGYTLDLRRNQVVLDDFGRRRVLYTITQAY